MEERIKGSIYEKEQLLSKLKMSYYPELDSHIRDKVKVLQDLSNFANKKELEHTTGADKSNLATKSDFFALTAEVSKLYFKELVKVPIGLNYLKINVYDLYVGMLKAVPKYLKKIFEKCSE